MSLKETIILWNSGVEAALAGNFDQAISEWISMPEPGAKIYYNIACMRSKQGQLDQAIKNLDVAVKKDPHLALAFFQRGCLLLQKKKYDAAFNDFEETQLKLRSNPFIDYKQLGVQYKLYACEVQYNQAFVLMKLGRNVEAMDELTKAKTKSANYSESRHKMIAPALESMRAGRPSFQAYELPDRALLFQPPKNKTEVLKPVSFLASARVLSSVKDNDSYVGFVGVQDKDIRGGSKSPTPSPSTSPIPKSRNKPERPPPKADKPDKPDVPPPPAAGGIKVPGRNSSLRGEDSRPRNLGKSPVPDEFKKVVMKGGPGGGGRGGDTSSLARPPKPSVAPPPFHPDGNVTKSAPPPNSSGGGRPKTPQVKQGKPTESLPLPAKKQSPRSPSPTTGEQSKMTVKVHYSSTRALRINISAKFHELEQGICKKFGCPLGSLTFYSKKRDGELLEVHDETSLKELTSNLEDGFRLTLWAYDKHESSPEPEIAVLKTVIARFAYTPQYDDELGFGAGDLIEVTVDINDDWYEGKVNGNTGIFPKSYVKDA